MDWPLSTSADRFRRAKRELLIPKLLFKSIHGKGYRLSRQQQCSLMTYRTAGGGAKESAPDQRGLGTVSSAISSAWRISVEGKPAILPVEPRCLS